MATIRGFLPVFVAALFPSFVALGEQATGEDAPSVDVASHDVPELGYKLRIRAPNVNEALPVIVFSGVFRGRDQVYAYSDFFESLYTRGYIIVALVDLSPVDLQLTQKGQDFFKVLEWINTPDNLKDLLDLSGHKLTIPDLNKVAVMGHSQGNHIVSAGLIQGCSCAKAQIEIDPVDGGGLFGAPTLAGSRGVLPYSTPTLILDAEMDNERPAGLLKKPCAPFGRGAQHWYQATAGPVFNVNATRHGHLDIMNHLWTFHNRLDCPTDWLASNKVYQGHLAFTIDLFLAGLFDGDSSKLEDLTDSNTFTAVKSFVKFDLRGLESIGNITAGCTARGAGFAVAV